MAIARANHTLYCLLHGSDLPSSSGDFHESRDVTRAQRNAHRAHKPLKKEVKRLKQRRGRRRRQTHRVTEPHSLPLTESGMISQASTIDRDATVDVRTG